MPAIAHLGVGLAAGRITKAPLGVLLAASEATDILGGALALARVPTATIISHSLFTSAALSAAAGLAAGRIYRDANTGVAVGLVTLSHWALDFIVWKDHLPLLYEGSPKVGLGFYNAPPDSIDVQIGPRILAFELALPILGFLIYMREKAA